MNTMSAMAPASSGRTSGNVGAWVVEDMGKFRKGIS
jgi:hypothetical protein